MSNVSNSHRILQELVSVEAWHKPLEPDTDSPFRVALSFGDARYSGDDETPIEFQVELKRATLVVVCDNNLRVPKGTTVRVYPPWEKNYREVHGDTKDQSVSSSQRASADASASGIKGASGGVSGARGKAESESNARRTETEYNQIIRQHVQMNYQQLGDEHHWHCDPVNTQTLRGSAHTGDDPVMELRPTIDRRLEDLGIRVFVKCKADDFEIRDISAKKSFIEKLTGEDLERRKRLAKEVIKHKLAEADLEVVDLEPRFREVVIADIMSIPER
jgi:hypothetical protein